MILTTNQVNHVKIRILKQKIKIEIFQISGAIIWAALILICSMLLKDSDKNQMVINALIIGAGLQISLLGCFANKFLNKENIAW